MTSTQTCIRIYRVRKQTGDFLNPVPSKRCTSYLSASPLIIGGLYFLYINGKCDLYTIEALKVPSLY